MSATVIAFMVLSLLAVAATLAFMALGALHPRHVHPAFHGLQRRIQGHMAPQQMHEQSLDAPGQPLEEDALAIFDSLFLAAPEPEIPGGIAAAFRTTGMPTLTSDSALPQAEVLLFLRAEIMLQLDFDPDIRGTTVNLTRAQYRKLEEYTGFAFDTIETPESYLGKYGITELHYVPRRGGFGYHSIGH